MFRGFQRIVTRGTILTSIGTFAAGKVMAHNRKRWENAKQAQMEALLDHITPYDIGRGAGKLIAGWLQFVEPTGTPATFEIRLQTLLTQMDKDDHLPEEQARSRYLASKTLFSLEGFTLSHCRYEALQQDALSLIRKNPKYKKLGRNDLFRGTPFALEDLIATTHRMLLMLDDGRLAEYLQNKVIPQTPRQDADYMARLIAVTLAAENDAVGSAMCEWFEGYCDFKIKQNKQQETFLNTSIKAATGQLPASVGMNLLENAWRLRPFRKR